MPAQEMMTFLLQFFMSHHCITDKFICDWYHNKQRSLYQGHTTAKRLATLFVQSIISERIGKAI